MKKAVLLIMLAGILGWMAPSATAESIWFKQVDARYDYTKYATWLMTQLKIDFGVWPVASGHTTGAVYTDDGWATAIWQNGQWQANVTGPFGGTDEAWSVWINAGGENGQYMGQPFSPFTIEYALYVTDAQGNWYWANNGGQNFTYYVD
jgi:hypothetical protein